MLSKSKFLKTTVLAALLALAGAAAVTPASAHEYNRDRGYSHSRFDGNHGRDRDQGRHHNNDDRGRGSRHDHRGSY